jgi:hypothetical protein
MENKEVILKKIPLRIFLDILNDAWDNGADYIDIIGVADEEQDNIAIAVREEYMNDGTKEERFDVSVEFEDEEHDDDKKDITDEDLNQLL